MAKASAFCKHFPVSSNGLLIKFYDYWTNSTSMMWSRVGGRRVFFFSTLIFLRWGSSSLTSTCGVIGWITELILHVMLTEACPSGIVFPGVFFPLHCIYSKISLINFCSKPLQDVVYIHRCSGILFSHIKRNGFESVAVRWMNLEPYTEWHKSEREQVSYINKYHIYIMEYR